MKTVLSALFVVIYLASPSTAGINRTRFINGDVWMKFNELKTKVEAEQVCKDNGGHLFAMKPDDVKKPMIDYIIEELFGFVVKAREKPDSPEGLIIAAEKASDGKYVWMYEGKPVPFEGYLINQDNCAAEVKCCVVTLIGDDNPHFSAIPCNSDISDKFLCVASTKFQEVSTTIEQVQKQLDSEISERKALVTKFDEMSTAKETALPAFGGVYAIFAVVLIPSLIVAVFVYLVRKRYGGRSGAVRFNDL